jgi:hypothetical protein
MPRINTRDAAEYVADLAPFTSNGAISADFDDAGAYVVKSYATAIAVIYPDERRAVLNAARYSATTTQHQHHARGGVSRLGFMIREENTPENFEILTGHRARLRGANGWA